MNDVVINTFWRKGVIKSLCLKISPRRAEKKVTESNPSPREQVLWELAQRLGHKFKDLSLLGQALRHSSYANENPGSGPSNELLEYLGDAVLALTVSKLLLQHFPESSEGELSRARAALVNARQLAALARRLNLGAYLLLGRGEESHAGREKPSLLADALEAVLAAGFLDGGLRAAEKLTRRWFSPLLPSLATLSWQDFKTALQEFTQARDKTSPTYHLMAESGPAHDRHFLVEARLMGRPLARGAGKTKKQAAQTAARLALERLREESGGGG
ncbi:MAG: ribonuclease III [Deltaproteobacteria bacterium]|nr:ribonuclease III [Deltaproteobacteria bacterium]